MHVLRRLPRGLRTLVRPGSQEVWVHLIHSTWASAHYMHVLRRLPWGLRTLVRPGSQEVWVRCGFKLVGRGLLQHFWVAKTTPFLKQCLSFELKCCTLLADRVTCTFGNSLVRRIELFAESTCSCVRACMLNYLPTTHFVLTASSSDVLNCLPTTCVPFTNTYLIVCRQHILF